MIRMTRLTDYGIVLLTRMARLESTAVHNARDLAGAARLPLPTVNKVLKTLTRKGFLTSHRGVKGGYRLARAAEEISVLDVVTATEGPIAITECSHAEPGSCEHEGLCPLDGSWRQINEVIRQALDGVTLAQLTHPLASSPEVLPLRGYDKEAPTSC